MAFLDWVITYEPVVRLSCFFSIFFIMASWEVISPYRTLVVKKSLRWFNNLGLTFFNLLLLRLLFPTAAVGVAIFSQQQGWGILNYTSFPLWLATLIAIVVLDLMIYLQHVMVHAIPLFWRVHRVHHADLDYDLTTGARFHPLEIIFSMLFKFIVIISIGPPVIAVIIFEVVLNGMAMFNHANIHLSDRIDRLLRWVIVTPDMHRIHHSIEDDETNSNFGFNLSCWDRLFGTYRKMPRAHSDQIQIGIYHYNKEQDVVAFFGLLRLPFKGKITEYAINTQHWSTPKNINHSED